MNKYVSHATHTLFFILSHAAHALFLIWRHLLNETRNMKSKKDSHLRAVRWHVRHVKVCLNVREQTWIGLCDTCGRYVKVFHFSCPLNDESRIPCCEVEGLQERCRMHQHRIIVARVSFADLSSIPIRVKKRDEQANLCDSADRFPSSLQ